MKRAAVRLYYLGVTRQLGYDSAHYRRQADFSVLIGASSAGGVNRSLSFLPPPGPHAHVLLSGAARALLRHLSFARIRL